MPLLKAYVFNSFLHGDVVLLLLFLVLRAGYGF